MQLLLFILFIHQSTFLPNFLNYLFYNTTPCQLPAVDSLASSKKSVEYFFLRFFIIEFYFHIYCYFGGQMNSPRIFSGSFPPRITCLQLQHWQNVWKDKLFGNVDGLWWWWLTSQQVWKCREVPYRDVMMVVMTSFIPVIPVMCHAALSCMPVCARSPAQIDPRIDEAEHPSLPWGNGESLFSNLA